MTARIAIAALLFCLNLPAGAEENGPWHGKQCAVCLTYDDGLNVHLDNVVPLLDSLGFRATFYIAPSFAPFRQRSADWKLAAEKGNELGDHTLFHPCFGNMPGREWVHPEYDLKSYTRRRMADEVDMAEFLLKCIDGRSQRTFAYPCGDTEVGDSSYLNIIRERFVAARGVTGSMQKRGETDLYAIKSFVVNGQTGDELIALVKQAMKESALVVFLFHGVGGEHSINVSLRAHRELLYFLKEYAGAIWVAPLIDIAEEIKKK